MADETGPLPVARRNTVVSHAIHGLSSTVGSPISLTPRDGQQTATRVCTQSTASRCGVLMARRLFRLFVSILPQGAAGCKPVNQQSTRRQGCVSLVSGQSQLRRKSTRCRHANWELSWYNCGRTLRSFASSKLRIPDTLRNTVIPHEIVSGRGLVRRAENGQNLGGG